MKKGVSILKPHKTISQIAKEKGVSLLYATTQLRKGMKVESEHSKFKYAQRTIALQHLDENIDYYKKLAKMEASFENGGKVANITFMEWVIEYNVNNKDEILVFFSLPSKYINPSLVSENNNNVILDVFEKQKDDIDAKKHFKKILDKADELGVTIYLEPIPRVHKLKSREHKQKITKDYLTKYYNNFGFTKDNNGFMVRPPKMAKGGGTNSKVYKGYSIMDDGNYIKNSDLLKKGGKTKGGDCYVKAGSFCLSPTSYNFIGKPYLVHSEVRGQGNLEGLRYGHAWVEDDKNVYDFSNGREIIMPKEIYYLLGDIKTDNPKKYQRYTFNEARDKMLETQNYGSWDIQTDYKKGGEMNILTQIYIPPTLQTISKEHRVDMDFLNDQYEIGTKEELEHTPDIELAQAIVLHHLNENPEYYIIQKKAFEEQEANKLDGYYAKGGAISCEQLDENGERKIDMDSINTLTNCVMSLPQTKSMHFDYETNRYTQERNRLHKDIIYNIKKDVVCINNDQPIAILMGGSPASGKSTFLKKYSPYLLNEEILKIDADDIRSKLPEYKGYNATQTHLETKDIVNTLLSDRNIGLPCNFDVIYDGTMNSTKSYMPLITLLKDLGYKVFIIYIDKVKKDVIVKRALERYKKSGRFVPLEVIDDFFDKGTSAMEQLKFMVDGYMIVDGSDTNYKIISQGGIRLPKKRNYSKIGQPIQITENEIITEFKKGGELNPDNPTIKEEITHKSGSAGGMLVGNRHSEGGIKAINKSTNSPLEMEGGEVVITRNAVSDDQKREFEGEMLTNRQILSKINEGGGGVSFANGGDVPQYIMTSGKEYKYGGKTMKDSEIVSSCGCEHKMKEGGYMDDGISTHEFMHLKYGHKLQREGDLLIMNKVVPSYLSFSKYNQSLQQNQLKETYKGLLNREYEINFDELPHAIKGALMIGNQKMIDNYINQ